LTYVVYCCKILIIKNREREEYANTTFREENPEAERFSKERLAECSSGVFGRTQLVKCASG